ncbi:MAG TPA: amphi-Trp domain-containing protein [Thermoanaerobaculia bacterium]
MAERDIERDVSVDYFVSTLRRLADALERGEPIRIQVASRRFVVPAGARRVVEHEVAGGVEELALELQWQAGEEAGGTA